MIVRKIKPEELKRTKELFATAFEFTYDNKDSTIKVYEDTVSSPKSREDDTPLNKYAAFEDDDKIMTKKRLRNTEVTGMLPHVSAETVPCILCHFVRSSGKIPYRHEFVQTLFCACFLIRIESCIPFGRLAGRDILCYR